MLSDRFYIVLCLKPLVMLFSDSVTHYLCLFSVSNLLLDRSTDTNTLDRGVTCYIRDCRFPFKIKPSSFAYILIMLFVYKCYNLCESFFSIDTLLLQIYDVSCCISIS